MERFQNGKSFYPGSELGSSEVEVSRIFLKNTPNNKKILNFITDYLKIKYFSYHGTGHITFIKDKKIYLQISIFCDREIYIIHTYSQ